MSCFDKEHYKMLKTEAEETDVYTYSEVAHREGKYNGISVAYAQTLKDISSARMVEVAVSYCSPEDVYKKKHGKYQALLHFNNGETIQLPLGEMLRVHGPEYTGSFLVGIFSLL